MSIDDKATSNSNLENRNNINNKKEGDNEEETLVLIQFTDFDDAQYCQHFSNQFKTINIEKSNPIIQIGSRFYTGEYTNNIGTYLFFEETQTNNSTDEKISSTNLNDSNHSNQEKQINNNNNNNFNSNKSDKEENNFNLSSASSSYFGKSFKKLILTRLFIEERP